MTWTSQIEWPQASEAMPAIVPDDGLLTLEQVMLLTQFSKASIYNNVAAGKFPAPIKVGRSNRWLRQELIDYLLQRVIERNKRLSEQAQKKAALADE